MQQSLQSGKRMFSAAVAAATIAFSVGLAGLVAPMTAHGASAGDLIKGSLSTVYYYGYDGMRYTFSNEKTYMTWYSNFSDVTTISDSALADIGLGGNAVYRPGSRWVKIQSDPKVYAVANDGMIHWIESEEVAMDFAGSDWASYVEDVPDAFFVDYTVGASLMSADAYDGMLWMDGGTYYVAAGGEMRSLSSAARSANNLQSRFFLDGSGIDTSALSAGAAITGSVAALTDAAQTVAWDSGDVVTDGDLEISISSSTASGVSLPGGANAVAIASFDLEAGAEDASLDALALSMIGVGATTNISNVYLYEGSTRLTEARSVNAATRKVSFSSLDIDVEAGDTRTITVRVETSISQSAGDTFGFSIASASDATATGDVSGSFPIAGEIFTFTSQDVGYLDIDKSGTIDNSTIGEQDAIIGKFRIATNSEDASVRMITMKIDNASDHSGYKLWDDSVQVAVGEYISGDTVAFDLSSAPFSIVEGSSNVFSVSADIGGETADTIKVYIDNEIDVEAIGGDFGFGLCVDIGDASCVAAGTVNGSYDGASCTSSSGDCSYSTIEGGDVTIVSNGPTAQDIQVNSQDQVLMNFSITSVEEITVKDLDFIVFGDDDADGDPFDSVSTDGDDSDTDGLVTGTESSLKDIKIINTDTGAVVMGPLELDNATDDDEQTIDFSDDFTIKAGETINLAITVDVDNNVGSGTAFGATLDISGLVLEDMNGDSIASTSIVPSGDITGYAQTAMAASLLVALASTPGDVVTVDGTQNVLVNAFTFVAGTSGDLNVSSIKVSVYADEDNSGTFTAGDVYTTPPSTGPILLDVNDFISSCYLTDSAGNMLGSAKAPTSNGTSFTVSNTDWDLTAGETETLKVYCNFLNPSDGTDDNAFAFDIADLSEDIVVQDEDGNDVDPTTDAPNGGTSPTNSVYVHDAGSLAVTVSSNTPSADFILTSSSDVHVASYTFTATREDFEVKTISFSEEEAEDDTGTPDSNAYANNISLVSISYVDADGETVNKSAAMSGNEVKFSLASTEYLYVPVGEPQDVDVYVNVPLTARDAGGSATSNEEIRMGWFLDVTNADNFKVSGVGSGITFTDTDKDGAGTDYTALGINRSEGIATFVVRETKPTLSISSSSPSGDAAPSVLEALRFNVAAASNENVVLEKITFKVTASDNAATDWDMCDLNGVDADRLDDSDFSFYEVSGGTLTQLDTADTNWTLYKTTGALCDNDHTDLGFVTLTLPTAELVTKGGTATYVVKVNAAGASSLNNDTLRLDIVTDLSADFITSTTADNIDETALAAADRVVSVDAGGDFAVGDVICLDLNSDDICASTEERMLVVAIDTHDLTVVRGYMNSPVHIGAVANDDHVLRAVGGLLWQDDGSVAVGTAYEERFGAYMVDYLDLNGGTLVF